MVFVDKQIAEKQMADEELNQLVVHFLKDEYEGSEDYAEGVNWALQHKNILLTLMRKAIEHGELSVLDRFHLLQ